MNCQTNIYTLSHPLTKDVKYIGKSDNPKNRFYAHIGSSRINTTSHKRAWINSILKLNLKPILEIIDEVPKKEWEFWERHYISLYKSWGFNLTNATNGGEGGNPDITSKTHKGKILTDQQKKHLSICNLGKKQSIETIEKRMRNCRGEKHYNYGKKRKPEDCKKISDSRKGKKLSKEHCLKISERMRLNHPMKGRHLTNEHKAKLWANRSRIETEQSKINRSIAVKKWWNERRSKLTVY